MTLSLAQRISVAAHRDLPHANPLSSAQFDALVAEIAARQPRTVIDIGCGWGSFGVALATMCDTTVVGVDINDDFLARARSLSAARPLLGRVEFSDAPIATLMDSRFDAVACIGASQAFGAQRDALARCATLLATGGTLLFADGVWDSEPPQEFLDFLGGDRSMFWTASEADAVFASAGLVIQRREVTSAASWQAYEDAIHRGRMRLADELATDEPDVAAEVRDRATRWTTAWQRWGAGCLGFTAYVAERAPAP